VTYQAPSKCVIRVFIPVGNSLKPFPTIFCDINIAPPLTPEFVDPELVSGHGSWEESAKNPLLFQMFLIINSSPYNPINLKSSF